MTKKQSNTATILNATGLTGITAAIVVVSIIIINAVTLIVKLVLTESAQVDDFGHMATLYAASPAILLSSNVFLVGGYLTIKASSRIAQR